MKVSTLIPWWGGSPEPLKRTIDSVRHLSDDVVVVHQQLFDEDAAIARSLADTVATIDWNGVFKLGFGEMTNQGLPQCKRDWVLWLGVGETVAEEYKPILQTLKEAKNKRVTYRCNHVNDVHTWGRLFNHRAGIRVGGWIHEDTNGEEGPVIFRMQDTVKPSSGDPFKDECLKQMKGCAYNHCYQTLGNDHSLLSSTNAGWLDFITGAKESIDEFCENHSDLLNAAKSGDREAFYAGVRERMAVQQVHNMNFAPTGQPMSEGALPAPV